MAPVPAATVAQLQRSASDSNLRCDRGEWFRLQDAVAAEENGFACRMPLRTQAETGGEAGGIILSKKPPEWSQAPPQQRSASDSNLRCCRGEWFRLQDAVAAEEYSDFADY